MKKQRILILSLSGIGNYIMQSPAIAAVRVKFPSAHITVWVAPRGTKPLAEADKNVDEVIQMPIKASALGHVQQILKLRRMGFDVGIVLSPGQLVKSAAYLFLAGIPVRVGATYPFRGNPKSLFLLTDAVDELSNTHDIEQNLHLLEPLGITDLKAESYKLEPSDTENRVAEKLLNELQIPIGSGKTLVGIHAGSAPDLAFKRWPAERFTRVTAELIKKYDAHVLIFGGPDEESQKQELHRLIGQESTIISAPILTVAAIMKHLRLMITNDSGLMHLAAAVDTETIGLFGPTSEVLTGPRGPRSHVIRAIGTKPVYKTEEGANLGTEPHESILAITPELVIDTVSRILGQ